VNYRQLWWCANWGDHVIAINAVCGIACADPAGWDPDQMIDYTWGREHTFTGDSRLPLNVDSPAFTPALRQRLLGRQPLGVDVMRMPPTAI
jgi:5'-methylthioinosine phosphorylase